MLKIYFLSPNVWTIQIFVVPLGYQRDKRGRNPGLGGQTLNDFSIMTTNKNIINYYVADRDSMWDCSEQPLAYCEDGTVCV